MAEFKVGANADNHIYSEYCTSQHDEEYSVTQCDPCNYDDKSNEAIGYCQQCEEYLCGMCIQWHKKFQTTRSHIIDRGERMFEIKSKRKADQEPVSPLLFCEEHKNNKVIYFCSEHKSAYCNFCRVTKHADCVSKLIDENTSSDDTTKLNDVIGLDILEVTSSLKTLVVDLEKLATQYTRYVDDARTSARLCSRDIAKSKKDALGLFEKLETDLATLTDETEKECQEVEEDVKLCFDMIKYLGETVLELSKVSELGNAKLNMLAILKANKLQSQCSTLQNKLSRDDSKRDLNNLLYVAHGEINTIFHQFTSAGKIVKAKVNFSKAHNEEILEKQNLAGLSWPHIASSDVNTIDRSSRSETKDIELENNNMTVVTGSQSRLMSSNTTSRNRANFDASREDSQKSRYSSSVSLNSGTSDDTNSVDATPEHLQGMLAFIRNNLKVYEHQTDITKSFSNVKFHSSSRMSLKAPTDSKTCDITGIAVLSNDFIVACDHANRNVKLLSPEFELVFVCHMHGNPWDVAVRNHQEIVVTVTNDKRLQFLTVCEGRFCVGKKICTKAASWGIDIYDDHLFLTQNLKQVGRLEIRQMDGKILRWLSFQDSAGNTLLKEPSYIRLQVSSEGCFIFLTDGRKDTIACLDIFEGDYKTVTRASFGWPKGIITDCAGNCFVCLRLRDKVKHFYHTAFSDPGNVRFIKPDQFSQVSFACANPQAVDIRWNDRTLVVGEATSNELLLVKFQ